MPAAENVLPVLLKLKHQPYGEGAERSCFLLELDGELKKLSAPIVVISSITREAGDEDIVDDGGMYKWLGNSIRYLSVGRTGKAVQHAKLWLLHWAQAEGREYLEIVVSSGSHELCVQRANSGGVARMPAASSANLKNEVEKLGRAARLYARKLATSCGDDTHVERFINLLARADCPQGITFVASVPGKHSKRAQWGAAGLRNIIPAGRGAVRASVHSPFVGAWSEAALHQWCAHFEGMPDQVSLVWIDKDHPWAKHWLLPEPTLNNLIAVRSTLLQLCHELNGDKQTDHFHADHRTSDDRWSHAKVYAFKRGNSRRLLLTSANFSKAAWGEEAKW